MSSNSRRKRRKNQREKPLSILDLTKDIQDVFLDKVFLDSKLIMLRPDIGPCAQWTGCKDRSGYPLYCPQGHTMIRAHRAVCEIFYGRMGRLIATHRCDNPSCVHPAHLRPGTEKSNGEEAKERRRSTIGARNKHAVLTEAQVREIVRRRRKGESACLLAVEFNVKMLAIQRIMRGETWQHLTDMDRSRTEAMNKKVKHGILRRGPDGKRNTKA